MNSLKQLLMKRMRMLLLKTIERKSMLSSILTSLTNSNSIRSDPRKRFTTKSRMVSLTKLKFLFLKEFNSRQVT